MKNKLLILSILIICKLSSNSDNLGAQTTGDQVSVIKLWETPDLLTTCESVCLDATGTFIYVSCINGNPADRDGNGFISKLTPTGEIVNLKWLEGLDAPKGMGIYMDILYVTDIDKIIEIDIDKSVILNKYAVAGSKFLNDITIDPEGNIYISDMATNKIHRLSRGVLETWLENSNINSPNGLFYENEEILIGTKNGLYSAKTDDQRTWIVIPNTGSIDGLESDGKGNYIISDWMGRIQLVNPDQDPIVLVNTSDQKINAADIEFSIATGQLYVPTFSNNRVVAYEIFYK